MTGGGRRAVTIRHEVTGTLETVTALRVAGWGPSTGADLAVIRDGLGRAVIPGTSLAGAMRAWLGTVTGPDGQPLFRPADLGRVFGDLTPGSQDGELCLIRVDDAVAAGPVEVAVRDGVGIDRGTGSAAAGLLYQHEVIPPGTRFAMRITASVLPGDPERVGDALTLIVAALADEQVEVGAARTRGLGVVKLTGVRHQRADLADRASLTAFLCGRLPDVPVAAPDPGDQRQLPGTRLDVEIAWSAASPVMVRAGAAGEPEPGREHPPDVVPLRTVTGQDGETRLLLPGSSIKGVLRSHGERIMRTLLRLDDLPEDWLDQVGDERLRPVITLFGAAGDHAARGRRAGRSAPDPAAPRRRGRRGALSVRDCHAAAADERVVTHVAVDRWTGGAAENLLFAVREPASAQWEPMRLSLDVRRSRGGPGGDSLALVLFLLILRDLADGWLAFGFGGTRGRGTVRVSDIRFSGSGLAAPWGELAGKTLAEVIEAPPAAVTRALAAWQEEMRG